MTRKQIVLQLLYLARTNPKPYMIHDSDLGKERVWISGGWRPVWYFVGHGRGGSAGYIRLWELRDHNGVPVEIKNHEWSYWNGTKNVKKSTPIYRLNISLYDLPFTNIEEGINSEEFSKWNFKLMFNDGQVNLFKE